MMIHQEVYRTVFALVFVCVVLDAQAEVQQYRYDGYKIVSVQVESALDVAFIESIGGDIWSHHAIDGVIDVCVAPAQWAALRNSGLAFEVRIDDLQTVVEAERAAPRGAGFFESFHSYDEINAYLEQLVANHPDLASMVDIGLSLEGRSIRGIRIASPNLNEFSPAVVYFSAVHAREWITTMVQPYLANHLLTNYGIDSQVTDLVDRVEWFLIPVANPDGYEYSRSVQRFWRKNLRNNGDGSFGVDINRNWGWGWGGIGSSSATGSEIYRGTHPFSEPETAALQDLFINHPNVRAQMDIHSFGKLILWPWGHTSAAPPDHADYNALGIAMRQLIFDVHFNDFRIGPIYSAIYPVSGDSVDWTYGERGIWSMAFELRGGGFSVPPSEIIPSNEEVLPAMLHLTGSDEVLSTQLSLLHPLPDKMTMGQPLAIQLAITSATETIHAESALLHYQYDASGPFKTIPLRHIDKAHFEAQLPATNCSSTPRFYFTIDSNSTTNTWPLGAPFLAHRLTMQHWTAAVSGGGQGDFCIAEFGDFNGDTEIDASDHDEFVNCLQGPTGGVLPECGIFDAESDSDVDLEDMQKMQQAISNS